MTPGSDFSIYTYPNTILSPATTTDEERGMARIFTPADLNWGAGTGYGRNVVPMELLFDVRSQPF